MKSIFKLNLIYSLFFILLFSCNKDNDDLDSSPSSFYKNAYKDLKIENVIGIWSIYSITYDGQTAPVPQNYSSCSRDFFMFSGSDNYSEYLFQDSECNFLKNNFSFNISNGVISLSNGINSDELVVTSVSNSELIFKAKYDIDNDGVTDILSFTAKKYQPVDIDLYTTTFRHETEYSDRIRLAWPEYTGFNTFQKYEIYSTNSCNKSDSKLITTITDVKTTHFVDEFPEPSENICYYLKLYTNQGLLGESHLVHVNTTHLTVEGVTMTEPFEYEDSLLLNWNKYNGFYFSHYEIWNSNFDVGHSGYSQQQELVTKIEDVDITSFNDENPPLFNNPTYYVIVYDIFGNKNFLNSNNGKETTFKNKKIIDIKNIKFYAQDNSTPNVYLLGSTENYQEPQIVKYNYSTNTIEAKSSKSGISNSSNIKLESSINGEELYIGDSSNEVSIFKTDDLEYKYNLNFDEINNVLDFVELQNNIWVLIDREYLYTYKRDFTTLQLISKEKHFLTTLYTYRYHILKLTNNSIIIGHYEEPKSYQFSIDSYGIIENKLELNIPFKSKDKIETQYNSAQNSLINLTENKVYSLASEILLYSYESPYYSSTINTLGDTVYGTNNNSEWSIDENSLHKKEIIKTNLSNITFSKINSEGYSHLIFENYNGQNISISSGLKRSSLYNDAPNNVRDIFIEILE